MPKKHSNPDSLFCQALARRPTPITPVWVMRQAGRYLAEYRAIRRRISFAGLCRDKDLVTEVTVMAQKKLGVDAAIIFSDLLLILEPLGAVVRYPEGRQKKITVQFDAFGPRKAPSAAALRSRFGFLSQAIRQTKRALPCGIPLIGFVGAPFTLASYLIEGGASGTFEKTRYFFKKHPAAWRALMEVLVGAIEHYVALQVASGADVIQVFDSWVGCLTRAEYRRFVLPYQRVVFKNIPASVPSIHFGVRTGHLLDILADAGGDAVGVDHRTSISKAWPRIGRRAIQGNLDPEVLFKDRAVIRRHVTRILREVDGRPGHIFNLGHGILPKTPVDNARFMVDLVHELSRR